MLIVADSSALVAPAVCDGLDVILQVYEGLKIPEGVYYGDDLLDRVLKLAGE